MSNQNVNVNKKLNDLTPPKETLGAKIYYHKLNNNEETIVQDFAPKRHQDHFDKIVQRCNEDEHKYKGNFYCQVTTRRERMLQDTPRFQYFTSQTCPSPRYDQDVYLANMETETLDFLWSIPSKEVCITMLQNPLMVPFEDYQLFENVKSFADETLWRKMKQLNGEQADSPLLI